jgi:glycerol-3-phosphate dehydrogenase
MTTGSLNARRREQELEGLSSGERVDLAVVGGGVTGAGIALDAASRGLSVALIEAHDLAFGASRWSSKLVHGGLVYLAKGDLALAHESAVERGILMMRTAPHLTRAMPQLFPLHTSTSRAQQALVAAGLRAGDLLRRAAHTPSWVLPPPRTIPAAEALALAPGLDRARLRGALLAYDGALIDDARLVVGIARTAARFGARILTRLRASGVSADRVHCRDELSGQSLEIAARQVINATGVWAGGLVPSVRLRPSLGSHLVLSADTVRVGGSSVTIGIPGEGNRFVFLLPQPDGHVYLGVTDEPIDGPIPDVAQVPESDVDFLLGAASTALARKLTRDDVIGSYAGLRPLIDRACRGGHERGADLSRKHAVLTDGDGVVTIVGGKLTTYRKMAADAVDAAVEAAGLHSGPATTDRLPLIGAASRAKLSTVDSPERLVAKYGIEAPRVAAIGAVDPELGQPLFPGTEITAAEVIWAVRHEGAMDADDVLARRTRLALVPAEAAAAAPRVHEIVSKALTGLV